MADKKVNVSLSFTADTQRAKAELDKLKTTLNELSNPKSNGKDFFLTKEIQQASSEVRKLQTALEASTTSAGTLDLGQFKREIEKAGMSAESVKNSLAAMGPQGEKAFQKLARSIVNAEAPLKRSNKLLQDFGKTLMNTAKWQISSSILHGFMGSLSKAYNYAKDLNESLNNIRVVTGQSSEQMAEFAKQANESAKALGTTTTKYTDAALIFYQQGLGDEDVKGRTDTVVKLANVTGQSAEEVSSYMTAIWNNFYDGSKSLEYYADVITKLGANTASSSAEIAEGLEKFAAIGDTVGLSYEYATSALATVVAQTRQSADTVGTAFKTIFGRIQGLKLGETLDDDTDLNKYSKALEAVGINIKNQNGELKDMDKILDEMGAKWNSISKDQQLALAQTVAGTRQYNQLVSLMDNWDKVQSNLSLANNSDGELEKQSQIYLESWKAASQQLKASLEGLWDDLLDDKAFIQLEKSLAKIVDGIDNFIDSIGGLKTILPTLGTLLMAAIGPQISGAVDNLTINFNNLSKSGKEAGDSFRKSFLTATDFGREDVVSNAEADISRNNRYLNNKYYEKVSGIEKKGGIIAPEDKENIQKMLDNVNAYGEAYHKASENILEAQEKVNELIEKEKELASIATADWTPQGQRDEQKRLDNATAGLKDNKASEALMSGAIDGLKNYYIDENNFEDYKQNIIDIADELKSIGVIGDENFKKIANSLKEVDFENFETTVKKLQEEFEKNGTKAYSEALEQVEKRLTKAKNAEEEIIKQYDEAKAKLKELKEGEEGYAEALSKVEELEKQKNSATNKVMEQEQYKTALEETKNAIEQEAEANVKGAASFRNFTEAVRETESGIDKISAQIPTLGQSIVGIAGSITSLYSAVNSLSNIGNIWKDEDLSKSEKYSKTIQAIAFAIPMIATAYKGLNTALGVNAGILTTLNTLNNKEVAGLLKAQGISKLSAIFKQKETKARLANVAATEAEKGAVASLNAVTWLNPYLIIGAAILGIIVAITKAIQKQHQATLDNAKDNIEKADKEIEALKTQEETLKSWQKAYEQYKETGEGKEDLNDISNDLIGTLDAEAVAVARLTGNYDKLAESIKEAEQKNLKKQIEENNDKYDNQMTLVDDALSKNSAKIEAAYSQEDKEKYLSYFEREGLSVDYEDYYGAYSLSKDNIYNEDGTVDAEKLLKTYDAVNNAVSNMEKTYGAVKLQGVSVYENSKDWLDNLKESIDVLKEIKDSGKEMELQYAFNDQNFSEKDSLESFQEKRNQMIQNLQDTFGENTSEYVDVFLRTNLVTRDNADLSTIRDIMGPDLYDKLESEGFDMNIVAGLDYKASEEKIRADYLKIKNNLDLEAIPVKIERTREWQDKVVNGKLKGKDVDNIETFANENELDFDKETFELSSLPEQLKIIQDLNTQILQQEQEKLKIQEEINLAAVDAEIKRREDLDTEIPKLRALEEELEIIKQHRGEQSEEYERKLQQYNAQVDIVEALRNQNNLEGTTIESEEELARLANERYLQLKDQEELENKKLELISLEAQLQEAVQRGDFNSIDSLTERIGEAKKRIEELVNKEYKIDVEVKLSDEQLFQRFQNGYDNIITQTKAVNAATSKIGDGFIVAAKDVEFLADNFPELFKNYEAFADGRIKLDDKAVENFKNGKKQEIEAEKNVYKAGAMMKMAQIDLEIELNKLKISLIEEFGQGVINEQELEEGLALAEADYEEKLDAAGLKDEAENAEKSDEISAGSVNNKIAQISTLNQKMLEAHQNWINLFNEDAPITDEAMEATKGEIAAAKGDLGATNVGSVTSPSSEKATNHNFQSEKEYLAFLTKEKYGDATKQYQDRISALLLERDKWEAYIAKLDSGAAAAATEWANSKGKGGKNDKDKDPKHDTKDFENYIEDELDRYRELKELIAKLDSQMTKLQKTQEHLHGKELIKSLNQEINLINKKQEAYKKLKKEQDKENKELIKTLKDYTGKDVEKSYDKVFEFIKKKYNDAVDVYNAYVLEYNNLDASAQTDAAKEKVDEAKKVLDKAKEEYDKYKSYLDRYDALQEEKRQREEEELEMWYEKVSKVLQSWETKIQIKLDMKQAKIDLNNFLAEIGKNIYSRFENFNAQAIVDRDNIKQYNSTNGIIAEDVKNLKHAQEFMDKAGKYNSKSSQFKKLAEEYGFASISEAAEKIKELQAKLQEDAIAARDLWQQAWDNYLSSIDQAIEKYDELKTSFEEISSELSHQTKMVELLYGKEDYDNKALIMKQQVNTDLANMESLRDWEKYAKEMYEKNKKEFGADSEAAKKWKDEWSSALSSLHSQEEKYIQDLKNQRDNAFKSTLSKLKEALGASDLDYVKEQWEVSKKSAEGYYDSVEAIYKLSSLENAWTKDINAVDGLKNQQKLKAVMDEQLKALSSKQKLSEYEVSLAEKEFNIVKAQIALEEAQNNKNKMKLTRDNSGNWSYQYIADTEDVADKQQALLDAQLDKYKLIKEQNQKAYEDNINLYTEYFNKYEKILNQYEGDWNAAKSKLTELQEAYFGKEGLITQGWDMAGMSGTDLSKFLDEIKKNSLITQKDLSEKMKSINEQTLTSWKDTAKEIADAWNKDDGLSVKSQIKNSYNVLLAADKEYKAQVKLGAKAAGESYTDIAKGVANAKKETDKLRNSTKQLISETTADFTDYIKSLNSIQNAWDAIRAVCEKAAKAAEQYYKAGENYTEPERHGVKNTKTGDVVRDFTTKAKAEEWIKKQSKEKQKIYKAFNTGGYTGDWSGDEGKLAVLHKKEIVLNKVDTSNLLDAISMVRDMVSSSVNARINGLKNIKTNSSISNIANNSNTTNSNTFNIKMEIENGDVEEIKQAILTLPTYASQFLAK